MHIGERKVIMGTSDHNNVLGIETWESHGLPFLSSFNKLPKSENPLFTITIIVHSISPDNSMLTMEPTCTFTIFSHDKPN